jgi:putative transcriptional regulator
MSTWYANGVYSAGRSRRGPRENAGFVHKASFTHVAGVKQPGRLHRPHAKSGHGPQLPPHDIRAIRHGLAKSQAEFARMIGVSVSTLQNWEQGRRHPEGPARALLRVTAANPDAVAQALGAK